MIVLCVFCGCFSKSFTQQNQSTNNQVYVYDTVHVKQIVYDTIYKDIDNQDLNKMPSNYPEKINDGPSLFRRKISIHSDIKQTHQPVKRKLSGNFKLSTIAGTGIVDYKFSKNSIYSRLLSDSYQSHYESALGIELNWQKALWTVRSGTYLKKRNSEVSYPQLKSIVFKDRKSVSPVNIIVTDTIDQYFKFENSDTTWHYVISENSEIRYDTSTVTDTLQETKRNSYHGVNSWTFLDIPITAGINVFRKNRVSINMLAGIWLSIPLSAKGRLIGPDGSNYRKLDDFPFKKFQIDGQVGLKGTYYFNNKMGLFVQPVYKYSVNNILDIDLFNYNAQHTFSLYIGLVKQIGN